MADLPPALAATDLPLALAAREPPVPSRNAEAAAPEPRPRASPPRQAARRAATSADPEGAAPAARPADDYATAEPPLRALAEAGVAEAEYALGVLHGEGRLGEPDLAAAYSWVERAAARGHPEAPDLLAAIAARMTPEQRARATGDRRGAAAGERRPAGNDGPATVRIPFPP